MRVPVVTAPQNTAAAIGFALLGVTTISIHDVLIKQLSGGYPLHQMIFIRSAIGIICSLMLVQIEGGFAILSTHTPGLHLMRGALVVISNLTFFTALAVLPLAEATALFFVAPLMITLLSIPLLGERVGRLRLTAVSVGFAGVVLMMRPWGSETEVSRFILFLPVLAALSYSLNQILTRRLGATTRASAMAVYIQGIFLVVSLLFYLLAGDGRYAEGVENGSVQFLLRAWVWPEESDQWLFLGLGLNSAIIGFALAQAYRLADAAVVAPLEYIGLPLAIFWGWVIWGEVPVPVVWAGSALILGSGLLVVIRERFKSRRLPLPVGERRQ